jgi:hypothetical protein
MHERARFVSELSPHLLTENALHCVSKFAGPEVVAVTIRGPRADGVRMPMDREAISVGFFEEG